MIWHETANPAVIVMLTQTWEAGRDKCFQYFPEDIQTNDVLTIDDDNEFGDGFKATIKLLSLSQDAASRSTIRKMALSVDGEQKIIWHLLFSGWPDFCVPEGENQSALLQLIKLSEDYNAVAGGPRIIHCSAGVGRSGTFIALNHLLQELDDGSIEDVISKNPQFDPVFDTVNKLREQRMTMVQSDSQLVFIYQVLREKWLEKKSASSVLEVTEEVEPRPPGAFPED
jgi:protein-tyrosine phosphatase